MRAAICGAEVLFQSTLSMRRATVPVELWDADEDISIHALHEESDPVIAVIYSISIHALHEESDPP